MKTLRSCNLQVSNRARCDAQTEAGDYSRSANSVVDASAYLVTVPRK
jgi:hypothetical protein